MRSSLTLFAAVIATSFALSTSASAATILAFSQQTSTDAVTATVSGSSTTLNTKGPASSPTAIPITLTQIGDLPNQSQPAFEIFSPALSSGAAITNGQQSGFNGTITISQNSDGTGILFLRAVITNGTLNANGAAGGFNAASGTTNTSGAVTVTLTSGFAPVIAAMGGSGSTFTTSGAVALSLVGITPTQSGVGFTTFAGQNTGNFSTVGVIPEPASLLSASTAILAGLGCFGWSRRKKA